MVPPPPLPTGRGGAHQHPNRLRRPRGLTASGSMLKQVEKVKVRSGGRDGDRATERREKEERCGEPLGRGRLTRRRRRVCEPKRGKNKASRSGGPPRLGGDGYGVSTSA